MTVDREQIRRDAEAMVAIHGDNAKLAHACLRVLAELEQAERRLVECALVAAADRERAKQAERERDEERKRADENRHLLEIAERYTQSLEVRLAAYEQEQKP